MTAALPWILLSSRLPRDPSRLRLAVWRRLKRLGAILIHDAVWMLPADAKTREAFEWLAEEIEEQGGTAWIWEAAGLSSVQDRETVDRFREEADARYAAIGLSAAAIQDAALGRRRPGKRPKDPGSLLGHAVRQLRGLERALRLEYRRDYFRAAGRAPAADQVAAAISALEVRLAQLAQPAEEGGARAVGH